jgi:formyltetrahydrofolate deformylase
MPSTPATLIALLHGPDQPGLVARVASWIFDRGGNILHADQHRDMEAGIFFQRVEWQPALAAAVPPATGTAPAALSGSARATAAIRAMADQSQGRPVDLLAAEREFTEFAHSSLGMQVRVLSSVDRPRIALFVSKASHCFHDLILRWKAGDYTCDIVAIVSNHTDLAEAAQGYGLPFFHIPVTAATKSTGEAQQLELMRELRVQLVVLARYMQVLSADFLTRLGAPVINIHHSFLPAFAGGKPYHQAHARGVKLIGATAHYATADLDEGPIIHQDVARVTHRHGVEDLVRMGRDLERVVLADAVRWHLEGRVLVYGNKTVVFD